MDSYSEILNFLYQFTPAYHRIGTAAFKPGLEKSIMLDEYFRKPHQSYITIHVGGTNGKGSVSHAIAAVLIHAGYK
jgi:dihydrofolate synthase/folylpolyglutamate synthase